MKLSFIQAFSIFGIPMEIKSRRWIYWERKALFLGDKESEGLPTAYRWAKRYFHDQW